MAHRSFTGTLLAEMTFWLGILRDHTQFILVNLSPTEGTLVKRVLELRSIFLELYEEVKELRVTGSPGVSPALVRRVLASTDELIAFKRELLERQLHCRIALNQPPTFTQHMINEAEEFVDILSRPKPQRPQSWLEEHLLWLPDAWGHAAYIAAGLDSRETSLIGTAMEYKQVFAQLYLKAEEIDTMIGKEPEPLPVLREFNAQVIAEMQEWQGFLVYLRDQLTECRILSWLSPLVPDHMAREAQYYLEKIR